MASTEGAMICCIRSVTSIPPDLRQTNRASKAQCGMREERNKKSGPVAHPDASRQGPFWRDYRIVWDHEGNIAKLRHVARIFHNPSPAIWVTGSSCPHSSSSGEEWGKEIRTSRHTTSSHT